MLFKYLTFGVTKKGNWIFIDDFGRGQPDLYCPFCNETLVAKQGLTKYHHFTHEVGSCAQVLDALNACQLPTIDAVELLDEQELRYLAQREKQFHHDIADWSGMDDSVLRLAVMGILSVDSDAAPVISQVTTQLKQVDPEFITELGQPSDKLKKIFTALEPLVNINSYWRHAGKVTETKINDAYHANNLDAQTTFVMLEQAQRYWLDAFCKRQHYLVPEYYLLLRETLISINRRSLYVMEVIGDFPNSPKRFLKIGTTSRHINFQLTQTRADFGRFGILESVAILATVDGAGRLEKLVRQKFENQRIQLGKEVGLFSETVEDRLWDELRSIVNIEPYIPPTFDLGSVTKPPGRQKKTASQLLADYPEVVSALKSHQMSVRKACRETGRASATVQKVKKAMQ